jgi:hypothetical protein
MTQRRSSKKNHRIVAKERAEGRRQREKKRRPKSALRNEKRAERPGKSSSNER